MKNLSYILSIAVTAVFFNSCTTHMYVSNAVNAPLLKEKGEVKINATGNDLQVAAGLGNNFGIMANGYYQTYSDDNNYEHRGGMGELGLGYFTASEDGHLVFEAFGGAGIGNVYKQKMFTDQNDNDYMGSFKANATKFFVQPDFGYSSKYFDAVFTPRFSFVKYTNFTSTNYPNQELQKDYLDNNRLTNPLFVFAEPAITLRGGYKFVKLQFQYGLTLNIGGNNIRHPDNFSSLGIVIDIAKWYND
jgi:hypothetical protein